ncbi:digestive cysteine proteinase 2-like [Lingula anatina]|uniref:Digestive cysteine proteinase 2-like n=1 Tax=Lingula anatina TaxID=7574 RepID=A0A1S3JP82_LINAN|nr:digestive cysteine proteinase 2-like [Lingula anatina]|eukprot:XP_013412168.1 digestive cysteine proteinase 2-like [Lingula anatina]
MTSKMTVRAVVLLICLTGVLAAPQKKATPPSFGKSYTVAGTLSLPYAELEEPFFVYFDAAATKSKIEMYNGLTVSIMRGDVGPYGSSFKIAYMTTDTVMNKKSCFQVNGTSDSPVKSQSILPDLTGFQLITQGMSYNGQTVDVWQNVTVRGQKKNTYTFMVTTGSNPAPVRYEMRGYDSLLGSHYDKYYVDYMNFNNKDPIDPKKFDPPQGMACTGFPGPGAAEGRAIMNPMAEYINNDDNHIREMFEHFKTTHKKDYKTIHEHETRKMYFRKNVRFIHSKNRAGLGYSLAVNHLADKSEKELKIMRGYRHSNVYNGGLAFNKALYKNQVRPDQMNWRLKGAVTPVKDQAVCGSCWSFGTAGTIEGAYFLKTGNLVRLSQQELMDCSWGEGNNGCDGGEDFRSYQWIMKHGGLTTEEMYGPYLAVDGMCHYKNVTPVAVIKSYVNVTSGDAEALEMAIFNNGPVSVAIDAAHLSLSFYANGVYYEPKCGNKPDDLDHAVLAVGYGTMNGQRYWLIKNSWSTYWGNDGYVLMAQKDNNCGVTTSPTYVNLK